MFRGWGDPNVVYSKRILAYPGWLDNAGSYDALAPVLVNEGYYVLAVDPVGCGKSSHLSQQVRYKLVDICYTTRHINLLQGLLQRLR